VEQVDEGADPNASAAAADDSRLNEMTEPEHAYGRNGTPVGGKTERANETEWQNDE